MFLKKMLHMEGKTVKKEKSTPNKLSTRINTSHATDVNISYHSSVFAFPYQFFGHFRENTLPCKSRASDIKFSKQQNPNDNFTWAYGQDIPNKLAKIFNLLWEIVAGLLSIID